jgi:hypothetical protein
MSRLSASLIPYSLIFYRHIDIEFSGAYLFSTRMGTSGRANLCIIPESGRTLGFQMVRDVSDSGAPSAISYDHCVFQM